MSIFYVIIVTTHSLLFFGSIEQFRRLRALFHPPSQVQKKGVFVVAVYVGDRLLCISLVQIMNTGRGVSVPLVDPICCRSESDIQITHTRGRRSCAGSAEILEHSARGWDGVNLTIFCAVNRLDMAKAGTLLAAALPLART
jgi:hypothetical protein